jgi:hypothetical protein
VARGKLPGCGSLLLVKTCDFHFLGILAFVVSWIFVWLRRPPVLPCDAQYVAVQRCMCTGMGIVVVTHVSDTRSSGHCCGNAAYYVSGSNWDGSCVSKTEAVYAALEDWADPSPGSKELSSRKFCQAGRVWNGLPSESSTRLARHPLGDSSDSSDVDSLARQKLPFISVFDRR